ncbi:MAG: nucleotidyltransferase domain-containing protein [Anaerolineae bacterium]|nr:nucleotidyltransferase domain-containing protein [Anaerolineae bacterium]
MNKMKGKIIETLQEIEIKEGVIAFYACESGSRAWGFPSRDSDYDVRFLYLHPVDWYLSIGEKRDVIEYPIDNQLDINGWDLKKALRLFRKSNPPLLEWLNSPIVYQEKFTIASQLRGLAKTYYSPNACIHHYLHMAQGNVREYLKGERVWLKKYFYVLRPILAIKWIEQGYGVAPTSFGTLLEQIVPDGILKDEIKKLIELKSIGAELDYGDRISVISDFIENELARLEEDQKHYENNPAPVEVLDRLFLQALDELSSVK